MRRDDRCRPFERGIGRIELQPDVKEFVPAGFKHLRTVGTAVVGGNVPVLALEERRVFAEHGAEVAEPAGVQHPDRRHVARVDLLRRRELGIGPHRVVVMVAGHDREWHLAHQQFIAAPGRRHLYVENLGGRRKNLAEHGVRRDAESAHVVFRIDGEGLVLPGIAEARDERDLATLAFDVLRDILHLLEKHFPRIEGKAFVLLVRVIDVVLGVRDHRDGELAVCRIGIDGKAG